MISLKINLKNGHCQQRSVKVRFSQSDIINHLVTLTPTHYSSTNIHTHTHTHTHKHTHTRARTHTDPDSINTWVYAKPGIKHIHYTNINSSIWLCLIMYTHHTDSNANILIHTTSTASQ